jgi:hypothetical protein
MRSDTLWLSATTFIDSKSRLLPQPIKPGSGAEALAKETQEALEAMARSRNAPLQEKA